MKKTKVFAAYLPQFHEIPENNEFWGEGFTDWVNVKKTKPLFEGHQQPKVPENDFYYDLTDVRTIMWQAKLAKEHGIEGFNIYHYWFKDGKKVLETPAEILLSHPEVDISYFLTWDNCSWVRTWGKHAGNAWSPVSDKDKTGDSMLLKMEYGDREQWEKHFNYLKDFFRDPRYLKIDGKPVFGFMAEVEKDTLIKMCEFWRGLAVSSGFSGLYLISNKSIIGKNFLDSCFIYEPRSSAWRVRSGIEKRLNDFFGVQIGKNRKVKYMYDYDKVWKHILRNAIKTRKKPIFPGAFVSYDDSPRRGKEAAIIIGSEPDKFYKYFKKLYEFCCEAEKEILIITAWNEWGEGAYLEPDTRNHCGYLEALKRALSEKQ